MLVLWPGPRGSEHSVIWCFIQQEYLQASIPAEEQSAFMSVALCSSMIRKPKQLQEASLMILAAFRFLASLPVVIPFLINTLSSSWFELIFLFGFCAHFASFVGPVLHLKLIFIVRISAFVTFLFLSESSSVFFQSFSVPTHPFLTVYLSFSSLYI